MKKLIFLLVCTMGALIVSCSGHKEERFNYTLIKSKMNLSDAQIKEFDEITSSFGAKARKAYEQNKGNQENVRAAVGKVFAEQDNAIQSLLDNDQFEIYSAEIKIEREGREKHNMQLIMAELGLDSAQTVQFDLANKAFYKTLIDNHDNYHGKPAVYREYYKELDVSRRKAFEELMNPGQFGKYLQLAEQFKIGQSEH